MAVTTRVRTRVGIQVWARSITYVATELMRVLETVVQLRGLASDYMHRNFKILEDGFRTWLTHRQLKMVRLEIYDPHGDRAVECCDLNLAYDVSSGRAEGFETQIEKVKAGMASLGPLPYGCQYRIVVDLEPDAMHVPGWHPTSFRDISHLRRQDLGNVIDTARIGVAMAYYM